MEQKETIKNEYRAYNRKLQEMVSNFSQSD